MKPTIGRRWHRPGGPRPRREESPPHRAGTRNPHDSVMRVNELGLREKKTRRDNFGDSA